MNRKQQKKLVVVEAPAQGRGATKSKKTLPPGTIITSLPKKSKKGDRRVTNVGGRSIRFSPWEQKYMSALINPFADAALGVKVPNYVPCETVTYKSEGVFGVTSNASGAISFLVTGSPTCSLLTTTGSVTQYGSTGINTYTGTTASLTEMATVAQLQTRFEALRVVSWGWRLRNNMNFANVQGRVIIAPILIPDWVIPGEPVISQANTDTALDTLLGGIINCLTGATTITTSLMNLPGVMDMQLDQLINHDLQFAGRPSGPAAYSFRSCVNVSQSDGTYFPIGPNDYITVAGGVVSNKNMANTQALASDWCGYMVMVVGLPASTNCVDLECIYHYEGTAVPSTVALAPSAPMAVSPVSTVTVEQIWQAVSNVGSAIQAAAPVAGAVGKGLMRGIASMMR